MLTKINLRLLCTITLCFTLVNGFNFPLPLKENLELSSLSTEAHGKSSGGRSRGGSFRSRPSGSSSKSKPSSSSPSRSQSKPPASKKSKPKPPTSSPPQKTIPSPAKSPPSSPTQTIKPSPSPTPYTQPNSSPIQTAPQNVAPPPSNRNRTYRDDDDDDYYYNNRPASYSSGGVYTSSQSSFFSFLDFLVFLIVLLLVIIALVILIRTLNSKKSSSAANLASSTTVVNRERDNDIFTITKLQVALLSNAPGIQSELSQLTMETQTYTQEGLMELLQESTLILLRNSDYWSHALSRSQSLRIDQAEKVFEKISLTERGKFSAETLSNVSGKIKTKEFSAPDNEIASYIVVTLIVGTADDKPLISSIHSRDQLHSALTTLGTVQEDYLMQLELLWSPQTDQDSLTYDELLTEYTDMIQIS